MAANLYQYLDEERKIMGFAVSELLMTGVIFILGFAFGQVLVAVIGMFSSVFIVRYVRSVLRKIRFKRRLFFIFSDLLGFENKGYYGKFYL